MSSLKNIDIYPRGIVSTVYATTKSAHKAIYWLARSGNLYATFADALADSVSLHPSLYTSKFAKTYENKGAYPILFVRSKTTRTVTITSEQYNQYTRLNPQYAKTIALSLSGENYVVQLEYTPVVLRVELSATPFIVPITTKPGSPSSVWVSRKGLAYRHYRDALLDNPEKAITPAKYNTYNPAKLFWIGLLLLILVGLLIFTIKPKE